MPYACVTTNLLDLRVSPDHSSERASQLLCNEVVTTGGRRNGFVRVKQLDGYPGWVDQRFLYPLGKRAALDYAKKVNGIVTTLEVRSAVSPHLLYYGTRFRLAGVRAGVAYCRLADGSLQKISARAVGRMTGRTAAKISAGALVSEARRFLGVPYLWGGISPAGLDCSGFVRALFGRFGIGLPRDTKDQIRAGTEVAREKTKAGDLLFFSRHVGIAMSAGRIIHASRGGSGVRIESLKEGDLDYRADLDREFKVARRLF